MSKQIVLAFSGGLDTAFCVKYLTEDLGFEVHTVFVNAGGFADTELEGITGKAYMLGAKHHENIDVTADYYQRCIRYLIFGNMLRNKTYPMSVSSERTFQAMTVAEYARSRGIGMIAHGSTGAGNDQVRFDMVFRILAPEIRIIAPVRDLKFTREYEKNYLAGKGVELTTEAHKYSINKGLWGTSVGGRETLSSHYGLPENAWPGQLTRTENESLTLEFLMGELTGGVDRIREINTTGQSFAIGRGIHTGDTIIGIKGRVGFEAPGPLMIIQAHQVLEKHVLTKWQIYWKDQLSEWYGMMLHEGLYLDPVMRNIEKFLEDSQQNVTGKVFLALRPYSFEVTGIESEFDLLAASGARYGEENPDWTGDDIKGFIRILSNSLKTYHTVNKYTGQGNPGTLDSGS
jgi:argininosuccinate synthase